MCRNLYLILFCLLLSCSNGDKKNNTIGDTQEKKITKVNLIDNLDKVVDAFYLSDFVDSIEILPLEIDQKHPFIEDQIDNLQITDKYIFFYSVKSGLLQYRRSGKFIRQIGSVGRGPGEYLLLRNYSINKKMNIIMGYSSWTHDLLMYDFEGKFLRPENPLFLNTNDYLSVNLFGKYYLIEQNSFVPEITDTSHIFNFAITDSLFNKAKILTDPTYRTRKAEIFANRYNPNDSWKNFYWGIPPVKKIYSDYMDFLYYGGDTIYRINDKLDVAINYIIEKGAHVPFDELHVRCHPLSYFDHVLVYDFQETAKYLFLDFGYKKYMYKARFNKNNGSVQMLRNDTPIKDIILSGRLYSRRREGKFPSFNNDLCGGSAFIPQWTDEKQWINLYPAYKLVSLNLDSLQQVNVKNPDKRDQLVKLIQNMKETDGPVLMIAHLKGN